MAGKLTIMLMMHKTKLIISRPYRILKVGIFNIRESYY